MLDAAFAKKLPDHFLDRNFLDVDIAHVAGLKHFAGGLSHFRPRHFQLDRHWSLLDHFTEPGKIPLALLIERKTQNLMSRKAIDNVFERPVEENFAVIDY